MAKAGDIFNAVRALVDDPDGDYATDEIQVPLLQLALDELKDALYGNPNVGKYKAVVIIPNVTAGTTSLKAYMGSGQPLELLEDIISMSERKAGDPDWAYTPMERRTDPIIATQSGSNIYYSFTGDDIILPGSTNAEDFRIFGTFAPQTIANKDSALPPKAEAHLKYATAALVARSHSNKELATDYIAKADHALMALFTNIILEQQLIPTRSIAFGENLY